MAYLTADEVRDAASQLDDDDTYPDTLLEGLIAEFEQTAERYRGVAFEPRTAVETSTVDGEGRVPLGQQRPRSVTTVKINGATLATTEYRLSIIPAAIYYRTTVLCDANGWPSTIEVTYSHGLDAPDATILRACTEYVRACAVSDRSGTSRDIIAQSFDGGFTRYSTPDWDAGRPTGWLEVDRLLNTVADMRPIPAA